MEVVDIFILYGNFLIRNGETMKNLFLIIMLTTMQFCTSNCSQNQNHQTTAEQEKAELLQKTMHSKVRLVRVIELKTWDVLGDSVKIGAMYAWTQADILVSIDEYYSDANYMSIFELLSSRESMGNLLTDTSTINVISGSTNQRGVVKVCLYLIPNFTPKVQLN